jgi:hypothetical protein
MRTSLSALVGILLLLQPVLALALAVSRTSSSSPPPPARRSLASDPIASEYPSKVTGTINGTTAVIPIAYALARSLIPSQYAILTAQYAAFLSAFPQYAGTGSASFYPLVLETDLDHDVQADGLVIPDFSSARITFPFVDLLGDGYSAFRYSPTIFLGPNILEAGASLLYGQDVVISTFSPASDPYAGVLGATDGSYSFNVSSFSLLNLIPPPEALVTTRYRPVESGTVTPPLEFYANVTNQPIFAAGAVLCDNMVRYYNTSISTGSLSPVNVQGSTYIAASYVGSGALSQEGVFGLRSDSAFIENNYQSCSSLQGYTYTG